MNSIRAFVGHSFTKDDETIVGKFLKYFDQLEKSAINFSWTSAEQAEPKELAKKVTTLIADKNLFIGICTKKQRIISPESLQKTWFPGG